MAFTHVIESYQIALDQTETFDLETIISFSKTCSQARSVYSQHILTMINGHFTHQPLHLRRSYILYFPFKGQNTVVQYSPFSENQNRTSPMHLAIQVPDQRPVVDRIIHLYLQRFTKLLNIDLNDINNLNHFLKHLMNCFSTEQIQLDANPAAPSYISAQRIAHELRTLIEDKVVPTTLVPYVISTYLRESPSPHVAPTEVLAFAEQEGQNYLATQEIEFWAFHSLALQITPEDETVRRQILAEHARLMDQIRTFPGFSYKTLHALMKFGYINYHGHFNTNTQLAVLVQLLEKGHISFELLERLSTSTHFEEVSHNLLTNSLFNFIEQGYFTFEEFINYDFETISFLFFPYIRAENNDMLYQFHLLGRQILDHFRQNHQMPLLCEYKKLLASVLNLDINIHKISSGYYSFTLWEITNALDLNIPPSQDTQRFINFINQPNLQEQAERILNEFQRLVDYTQAQINVKVNEFKQSPPQQAIQIENFEEKLALLKSTIARSFLDFDDVEEDRQEVPVTANSPDTLTNWIDQKISHLSQEGILAPSSLALFFSLPLQEIEDGFLMITQQLPNSTRTQFKNRYVHLLMLSAKALDITHRPPEQEELDKIRDMFELCQDTILPSINDVIRKINAHFAIQLDQLHALSVYEVIWVLSSREDFMANLSQNLPRLMQAFEQVLAEIMSYLDRYFPVERNIPQVNQFLSCNLDEILGVVFHLYDGTIDNLALGDLFKTEKDADLSRPADSSSTGWSRGSFWDFFITQLRNKIKLLSPEDQDSLSEVASQDEVSFEA